MDKLLPTEIRPRLEMLSIGRWLRDAPIPRDTVRFAWAQLALDVATLLVLIAVLVWLVRLPTF